MAIAALAPVLSSLPAAAVFVACLACVWLAVMLTLLFAAGRLSMPAVAVLGMLGALAAVRDEKHIALDVLNHFLPPLAQKVARIVTFGFAAAICAALYTSLLIIGWCWRVFARWRAGRALEPDTGKGDL